MLYFCLSYIRVGSRSIRMRHYFPFDIALFLTQGESRQMLPVIVAWLCL